MGILQSPVFANIFLSYHEEKWLANCPPQFKPVFIDDTSMTPLLILFSDSSHIRGSIFAIHKSSTQ